MSRSSRPGTPGSTRGPAANGALVAAPVALGRAAPEVHRGLPGCLPLRGRPLARLDALGRLLVEQHGFARRAAALRRAADDHGAPDEPDRDLHFVPRPQLAARL